MTSIFQNTAKSIKAIFKSTDGIAISSTYSDTIKEDSAAIDEYSKLLRKGISEQDAFNATMKESSDIAQQYVKEKNTETIKEDGASGFGNYATGDYISVLSKDKSLGNVKKLLNEYNSGLKDTKNHLTNCGLSQDEFAESVTASNNHLGKYLSGLNGGKATLKGYISHLAGAKAATIGLQIATTALNTVISMGIGWLISVLFQGLDAIVTTKDEALEELQESADSLKTTLDEIDGINTELDSTKARMDELNNQDSLSFVEQEELDRLKETTAELKAQVAAKNALLQADKRQVIDDFMSAAETMNLGGTDYKHLSDSWGMLGAAYDVLFTDETQWSTSRSLLNSMSNSELQDAYADYQEVYEYLNDMIESFESAEIKLEDLSTTEQAYYRYAKGYMWDIAYAYADSYGGLDNITNMIYNDSIFASARKEIDKLSESSKLNQESLQDLYNTNLAFRKLLEALHIDTNDVNWTQGFISWFNEDDVTEELSLAEEAVEEYKTKLQEMQDAYNSVKSVIDDYNDNGKISVDNFTKLLEIKPQYLALLVDENGQLNLNAEAYEKAMQAKLKTLTLSSIESLFEDILGMKQEEAQIYANATAYDAESDSLLNLVEARYLAALSRAKALDSESGETTYYDAIKRSIGSVTAILNAYSSVSNTANDTTKKFTDSLKEQKDALSKQKDELKDVKDDIQSLIDSTIDMLKQEKEDEKENYENQKEHLNELIEKRKEILQAKKDEAKFDKELAEKQNTVAQNALAASIAELDDSSAGKKAQKQTQDTLKESRSELFDTLDDHNFDLRLEALDKQQEQNEEYYDGLIQDVDDYLANSRQIYNDACNLIENDTGNLYNRLNKYVYEHTTMTQAEFDRMWTKAQEALTKYDSAHIPLFTTMSILDGQIYALEDSIKILGDKIDNFSTNTSTSIGGAIGNLLELEEIYNRLNGIKEPGAIQGPPTLSEYLRIKGNSIMDDINAFLSNGLGIQKYASGSYNVGSARGGSFASGTTSAPSGLSLVGEKGAELRVLNQGDGIIPANITKNLWAIGQDPSAYFSKICSENLWKGFYTDTIADKIIYDISSNINPNISAPISISINGDATSKTIEELRKLTPKIAEEAAKQVMKSALQRSNTSRVH